MKKPHLTPEQKKEIINSKLTNVELGRIYDINHRTISEIRIRAGKGRVRQGNYKLTPEQLKIIVDPLLSVREAHEKSGASKKYIYTVREREGIVYFKPVVEKPKKEYKPRVVRAKTDRSKRIRVKKPIEKKEIVIKSRPMALSKFESEQKELEKAKKMADNYKRSEAEKIADGTHGWVKRKNQYGKIEHAFVKLYKDYEIQNNKTADTSITSQY